MGFVSAIGRLFGRSAPRRGAYFGRRTVRAKYDAAQNGEEFRRHWSNADTLSADAANSPEVRLRLRTRARYEVANNPFGRGLADTLANCVVGIGPKLQVSLASRDARNTIERAFADWSARVDLAGALRLARKVLVHDGESFFVLSTGSVDDVARDVSLRFHVIEADRVATPDLYFPRANAIDGIVFDSLGAPAAYHILKRHPGDLHHPSVSPLDYDTVQATNVIHYFRADRAGQHRGIPEFTPALPLFALHRRYVMATLRAAELVADYAVMIETPLSPEANVEAADDLPAIEVDRGMVTPLPEGYKASQLKAEHPATTYDMFERRIIGMIARTVGVPLNIALGDSSNSNFSSGRLDHLMLWRAVEIDRQEMERQICDRLFSAWFQEAVRIDGFLPAELRTLGVTVPHEWMWPAIGSHDEVKEDSAREIRLRSGMTNYQAEYAALGYDWETEQTRAAESLGLTLAEYRELLVQRLFAVGRDSEARKATRRDDRSINTTEDEDETA